MNLFAREICRKVSDFCLQGHDLRPCLSKYNARFAVILTNQCAQCTMYVYGIVTFILPFFFEVLPVVNLPFLLGINQFYFLHSAH